MRRFRSPLAFRKRMHTLRVPAGDGDDCECGINVILTEDSQPILTEGGEYTLEESA